MPDGTQLGQGGTHALLTLPNVITFGRLCAVPVAVWLVLDGAFAWAFWLFLAAGLSDALDGWLARRGAASAVGAVLDPVADKALLVTMYVTLAAVSILPVWLAILVVFRDMVIVGGLLVLGVLGHPVGIRPIWISKLNTALQMLAVLIWATAVTTLGSGAIYVAKTVRAR
jgi:cardiolipin synthase